MNGPMQTDRRLWRRAVATLAASVTVGVVFATAAPAGAHELTKDRKPTDVDQGRQELYVALQRDLGLSHGEMLTRLKAQDQAEHLATELETKLGPEFGGAWFDPEQEKLVIAVVEGADTAWIEAAGAVTQPVKYDYQSLAAITEELTTRQRKDPKLLPGAVSWGVDVVHNTVLVTAQAGYGDNLAKLLSDFGDAVQIQETKYQPQLTAEWLDGGLGYEGLDYDLFDRTCSVGFNVANEESRYFITAGHCHPAGTVVSRGGTRIGEVLQAFYPHFDDAIVHVDNEDAWYQGGYVAGYPGFYALNGLSDSLVGTTVCSSGHATGWTCGVITMKDESVLWPDGHTVQGLTRHTACVEGGDSGGSNVRPTSDGVSAEGTTSGAVLVLGMCKSRYFAAYLGPSTSWYMPIVDTMLHYGNFYDVEVLHYG